MIRYSFPLVLVALAACTQPPMAPEPRVDADLCGAAEHGSLLGKNRSILKTMTFKQEVRQIGPNMPVTADFRADRLNIEYDQNDRITRVSCY